jgi:hypothetical protein
MIDHAVPSLSFQRAIIVESRQRKNRQSPLDILPTPPAASSFRPLDIGDNISLRPRARMDGRE